MSIKDEIRKINEQATQIRLITEEIIDHLPQEKEPTCVNLNYNCTISQIAGQIGIKLWQALAMLKYVEFEPTKEVPYMRNFLVDNRCIWDSKEWELIRMKWFELEEKYNQAISALYRKELNDGRFNA